MGSTHGRLGLHRLAVLAGFLPIWRSEDQQSKQRVSYSAYLQTFFFFTEYTSKMSESEKKKRFRGVRVLSVSEQVLVVPPI